jgi:bile acid:Na+ symporter, BASS family
MMRKDTLFRGLLVLSIACFIIAFILVFTEVQNVAGRLLLAGFISLAFAVRGFPKLKGFSYTVWIFAAVTLSMMFPRYFIQIGDFEMKLLIVPLLQVIMFGMGSQMSLQDFTGVIKMPKGVIIGVVLQFTIMPLVGFSIAHLFRFPTEIAAGILLIGCAPSGLASNVMSYIARANLALAVTLAAVGTLLAPLLTPLLMKLLAGAYVEINFWSMMIEIVNIIILPVIAGFIFKLFSLGNEKRRNIIIQLASYLGIVVLKNILLFASRKAGFGGFEMAVLNDALWFLLLPTVGGILMRIISKGNIDWLGKAMSFVSMFGIALIITVITAAGRDDLMKVGGLLILASLIHNLTGYFLGYRISRLLKMPERDCRTIAFEVGMQNGGLASGLALQMGKLATVGLAPAVFGPLMNITGSSLAMWWKSKPPAEDEEAG